MCLYKFMDTKVWKKYAEVLASGYLRAIEFICFNTFQISAMNIHYSSNWKK